MRIKRDLAGILFFCLVYRLIYFSFVNHDTVLYNSDSVTYFAPVNIFKGIVDLYRPPVYPYILNFSRYLSEKNFIRNLIVFQQIVSLLSIIPFYHVSRVILRNRWLVVLTTGFYGCWHFLINYNICINPECLCIAGSTMVLFLFVKYSERPTAYSSFFLGLSSLVLIMLKPTYLTLLFIVLVFLIGRFIFVRNERKILYWGTLGWLIAVIGVLMYCEMNKKYNGEFVLSKIKLNNSLANIVISGAYKYAGDKELITVVDSTKGKGYYAPVFYLNNSFIGHYKQLAKKFPPDLLSTDDMKYVQSMPDTIDYSYDRVGEFVKKSQRSKVYFSYITKRAETITWEYKKIFLLLFLEGLIVFHMFRKQRKIAWIHSVYISFVLGQFITITFGGIFDLDRLLVPAYPAIIILGASFFSILLASINEKRLIESIL